VREGIEEDGRIVGHFAASGIRSFYADRFKQWGYDLPSDIYNPGRRLG